MTHILAVDPGKVTGLALFDTENPEAIATYEVSGRHNAAGSIYDLVHAARYVEVVCEDFIISQRTIKSTPQRDPWYLLGWLVLMCETEWKGEVNLTLQTAAQAKSFADDAKLRKAGWFQASKDGHANDACRHLLTYLAQHHFHIAKEILS